tara:strand:+ start:176 stop:511 length:336 start_codon:yes stop_codon:yes gene_type:complete
MNFADEFFVFFKNNNLIPTIIATVVSTHITELTHSLATNIVEPIINRDADNDGKADIQNFEKYELNIIGIKFKVGKFLISLIKVLFIFFIIFLVNKYLLEENEKGRQYQEF